MYSKPYGGMMHYRQGILGNEYASRVWKGEREYTFKYLLFSFCLQKNNKFWRYYKTILQKQTTLYEGFIVQLSWNGP